MSGDGPAPLVLAPGAGRTYAMPTMRAVFKADGDETGSRCCVSEWWVEPRSEGPGAHTHDANDELFYVLEGTAAMLVGDIWHDAPRGSFILVPAGTRHDFANRTDAPMCLLNVFVPGGFEAMMPQILAWYEANPQG
jgi:mannose-6-phosphate isomerase-like protein (cupin superfamily)